MFGASTLWVHFLIYLKTNTYYVSKWVESIPSKTNDNKIVIKFLKENMFSRFGTPCAIISDIVLTFAIDSLKLICESMS